MSCCCLKYIGLKCCLMLVDFKSIWQQTKECFYILVYMRSVGTFWFKVIYVLQRWLFSFCFTFVIYFVTSLYWNISHSDLFSFHLSVDIFKIWKLGMVSYHLLCFWLLRYPSGVKSQHIYWLETRTGKNSVSGSI